jgi:hypothetical protein
MFFESECVLRLMDGLIDSSSISDRLQMAAVVFRWGRRTEFLDLMDTTVSPCALADRRLRFDYHSVDPFCSVFPLRTFTPSRRRDLFWSKMRLLNENNNNF